MKWLKNFMSSGLQSNKYGAQLHIGLAGRRGLII